MTAVSVVVPYRPDGGHRDRAWAWLRNRWEQEFPDWQVVEGRVADEAWCKATAVADVLHRADGGLLVVADADVWCDGIADAVEAVKRGAPWAVPHNLVRRLNQPGTELVLDQQRSFDNHLPLDRKPYRGVEGGGMVVLPRDTYARVPLDPRFVGWGQEDESWALALSTIAGRRWRGAATLWHLWHPPAPRLNRHVGSQPGWALHVRYQYAAKDGAAAMQGLMAEVG